MRWWRVPQSPVVRMIRPAGIIVSGADVRVTPGVGTAIGRSTLSRPLHSGSTVELVDEALVMIAVVRNPDHNE